MRSILQYPVLSGVVFEVILVALFYFFPAGACNSPPVGVAIVFLHYPALIFAERVLSIGFSAMQFFISAALMVPIWILLIFIGRHILYANGHKAKP